MTKELTAITADEGSIKAQVLADADGEVSYIKDAAERGCVGGNCRQLVYYAETHAFYAKHAEEIDEMLDEMRDDRRMTRIDLDDTVGDLRNFLAWMAYEVRAQEIMAELKEEAEPADVPCQKCGGKRDVEALICSRCKPDDK